MKKVKNQFRQTSIEFQFSVLSIKHLLGYVTYSFDQICYVESGSSKDHEFAAVVVNAAWDAYLVQQRKLDAKDKLLAQLSDAAKVEVSFNPNTKIEINDKQLSKLNLFRY